jgi:RHH-type rel operon transcriptional repressor/antitoxin RelB
LEKEGEMDTLTIRIKDETKKRLEKLAASTSRTKSYLVTRALEDFIELNEWQVRGIKKAIRQADAGQLVNHEKVVKRLESRLANKMD